MNEKLIDNISQLNKEEIAYLIDNFTPVDADYARIKARDITDSIFGRKIYIRGLIEISSICKNNCYYCGIRSGNIKAIRYRMTDKEIINCCKTGYANGFRTFVIQGGEDPYYTDEILVPLISEIKSFFPDSAVTLSLGERSKESYAALKKAGADRYLLRHETASREHYGILHPEEMSFDNRLNCLKILKDNGYQTGCGMMVGSPYQTSDNLAEDLIFIRNFNPEMVGIGPFIPHCDTPFANKKAGSVVTSCFLLSLVRIMLPHVLLPSTTALGSLSTSGRIKGLDSGANVIMPNLTPDANRLNYSLYDKKTEIRNDTLKELAEIKEELSSFGYKIVTDRGDWQ